MAMLHFSVLMLEQKPGDHYWLEQMDLHFCAALKLAKSTPDGMTRLVNFFKRTRSTSKARRATRKSRR